MKYKGSHFEIFGCFLCGEESNTISSHYNERNAPSGKRGPYREELYHSMLFFVVAV